MTATIGIVLAAAAILTVVMMFRSPSLNRLTAQAASTGDVTALASAISEMEGTAREDAFNSATKQLWGGYHRAQACALITAMGDRLGDTKILQYWIKQALEVEPEEATQAFDEDFLLRIYRPAVAQQCGSFG